MNKSITIAVTIFCVLILGCSSSKEIKIPIAITEKPIVEKQKQIVYVYHDEDGDWQFLSSEDAKMVEVFTMPLREMFDFDNRLKPLEDLPIGWRAVWSESTKRWDRLNLKEKRIFKNN